MVFRSICAGKTPLSSVISRSAILDPVRKCEGGGDVVGVVTSLVGGVAQAFHGDQVVELRVQLAVQEVEGKEEGQGRTGGSRRGEATQGGALMDDYGDEMTRLRS